MQLIELLPREQIVVPLGAATLTDALTELLECLDRTGAVHDADAILRGLHGQRARDIVAPVPDVVLPHYRSDVIERLLVALGTAPGGLDARASGLDVRPRLVALILAPLDSPTLYLQTVSMLARLFRDPDVVERLVAAQSPDDVRQLAGLAGPRLQPKLTVRDIMAHDVETVAPNTPVREAVDLMVQKRMRALPVVGEKQEVLGIIGEWDLMKGLLPQIPRAGEEGGAVGVPESMRVKDIMTRSVLCISADLGLEEAANMMINKDVEQFPVTSDGKLVGFVTRGDIIRKLFGR
jgi:CBS domain-containing protein/mannitol/fructose-specific phosphotransferase system IIA component (Ntr-type)